MEPFQLVIDRKIDRPDEGIPLGNGEIGCLVYGSAKKLVFSLDRGDVWDKSDSPEHTPGFSYASMVRLAKSGDMKTMRKIFDKPYMRPTPTKLPVGRIEFSFGEGLQKECFTLHMDTAECVFTAGSLSLRTFTHATQGVGMLKTNVRPVPRRIVHPKFGKPSKWDAVLEKLPHKSAISNKLKQIKYPAAQFSHTQVAGFSVDFFWQPLNDGTCFGIALGENADGQDTQLAYYVAYGTNAHTLQETLLSKVVSALRIGYDALFETHQDWWRQYHAKSSITVPDAYIQNRYNMGNYLLGAASRKGCYPMPLQGVWTICDDRTLPPWKGDYHHDLNTQMTYYSYLKANRLEQGECFLEYLESRTDRAREFAASFYGAKGICLPSVMDIDGYAMGGWPMYSLSPTNQLWLCQAFERHYTYTGDEAFLRRTAYPYMQQSAMCILSLLQEDDEGFYVLPISSSPEIHDNSRNAFLTPNSNYDQAMLLYIFSALARLAHILNETQEEQLWKDTLAKLRPLAVNQNHVLRIAVDADLKQSHRHQSHAMSIHPLRLLDYSKKEDAQIIDATIAKAVALGSKQYTGYSMTWLGEFFAVAKNGDKALAYLEIFWKYFCSVNTFHLNGDYTKQGYSDLQYRPFTLEGNFCALDVLQEMMLYAENGVLELFPAVPKKWRDVAFETLRAWGGVLVSAALVDGVFARAQFTAENDVSFHLRGDFTGMLFHGGTTSPAQEGVQVTLCKGETLCIEPA